jgi:hypothetical protein
MARITIILLPSVKPVLMAAQEKSLKKIALLVAATACKMLVKKSG